MGWWLRSQSNLTQAQVRGDLHHHAVSKPTLVSERLTLAQQHKAGTLLPPPYDA